MDLWQIALSLLASLLFITAIFFSIKLSRETKGEQYWFFFIIVAVSLAVAHLVRHSWVWPLSPTEAALVLEGIEIVSAFSLAYACFGLYFSMKKIREKMAEEG